MRNSTGRRAGRSIAGVAVVYGTSILSLFIGELLLARHSDRSDFGEYTLVRQAVPLLSTLALIGYDQALTREVAADRGRLPRLDHRQFRLLAIAFVTGGLVAGYLWWRLGVTPLVAATVPLAAIGVASSSIASGLLRATGEHLAGAAIQQGYRLVTGTVLLTSALISSAVFASWVLALSAVGVGAVGLWLLTRRTHESAPISALRHRHLRHLGVGYSLSMLALAAGDWVDQVLVGELGGGTSEVGLYGQLKLVSIYPLLSIGSVLGFLALPTIAARRDRLTGAMVRRWLTLATGASILLAAAAIPLTALVMQTVLGHRPSWLLLGILCSVGSLRLLYVLPSALIGATAPPRLLSFVGGLMFVGLGIQVVTTFALRDHGIVLAASLGLLASTLFRVVLTSAFTMRTVHRVGALSPSSPESSLR